MSDLPRAIPLFRAKVDEKGQLVVRDPGKWRGYLSRFKGREMVVRAEPERQVRSLSQNALYWSWHLKILAEFTGYTDDELHEVFKWRHLRTTIVLPGGEEAETVRSTTKLDIEGFCDYLRKIERDAAEMGCEIPDPGAVEVAI